MLCKVHVQIQTFRVAHVQIKKFRLECIQVTRRFNNKACRALLNTTRDNEPEFLIAPIFVTGRSNSCIS